MKGRVGVLMSIASHINLTAISATSERKKTKE